jgi:predicted dehydrogenase
MKPVKWGIVSTAKIGLKTVVPAMIESPLCDIAAIASRDLGRAEAAAAELDIPTAYGSYEELFADPEIEAIYNPLPNHLHVPVSIQAAEQGKHVLCEKPIALDTAQLEELVAARDRTGVQIVEAFMVRHHPQWRRAREMVQDGSIGRLRAVQSAFSYFNDDPANIRNSLEAGGGALYDIGVYPIVTARFLFDAEPLRVLGIIERDPAFGTDRVTTGLLEFAEGQASFVCSTQIAAYQRVHVFGTEGRIDVQIPFNPQPDKPARILRDDGSQLGDMSAVEESFDLTNQYRLQAEAFGRCLRSGEAPEFPLEDSINNMRVVDGLFESARENKWVALR